LLCTSTVQLPSPPAPHPERGIKQGWGANRDGIPVTGRIWIR